MNDVSLCGKDVDAMTMSKGTLPVCVYKRGRLWDVINLRVDPSISETDVARVGRTLIVLTQYVYKFIKKVRRIHNIYNTIKTYMLSNDLINVYSKEYYYYVDILEHYRETRDYYSEIFKNLESNRAISTVVLKYLGDDVGIFSATDGRAVRPLSLSAKSGCVIFHDVETWYVADAIRRILPKILKRAPKTLFIGTCDFLNLADKIIPAVSRYIGSECVVAPVVPASPERLHGEIYVYEALVAGLATLCGLRLCQP